MKCANCDRPGLYMYEGPGIRPVAYCVDDLPGFLRASAKSGALKKTDGFSQVRDGVLAAVAPTQVVAVDPEPEAEAPKPAQSKKTRSRKKPTPAIEETTEEAPVEEAPEEPDQDTLQDVNDEVVAEDQNEF